MRHAVSRELESAATKFKGFEFKPSPYSENYIELDTWPEDLSAKQAKEQLISQGITFVNIDPNGNVVTTL